MEMNTQPKLPCLYMFDGKEIKREPNLLKWSMYMWGEGNNRIIAQTELSKSRRVSTIFTGISFDEKPHLFETMVFGGVSGKDVLYAEKYATLEEANAGHTSIVEMLRAANEAFKGES
jgi:hypothetical protein